MSSNSWPYSYSDTTHHHYQQDLQKVDDTAQSQPQPPSFRPFQSIPAPALPRNFNDSTSLPHPTEEAGPSPVSVLGSQRIQLSPQPLVSRQTSPDDVDAILQPSRSHSTSQEEQSGSQDDWAAVTDPLERRKIQNRIAQREFRKRNRIRRQELENAKLVSGSYTTIDGNHLQEPKPDVFSGTPWGTISLGPTIKSSSQSSGPTPKRRLSQEPTVTLAAPRPSVQRATSLMSAPSIPRVQQPRSSSIGLTLTENFARGSSPWRLHPYRLTRAESIKRRRS